MPNFDLNDEFIEARYAAGANQYDLELFAAAPETMDAGDNSGVSGGISQGATNPVFNQVLGGHGNQINDPLNPEFNPN